MKPRSARCPTRIRRASIFDASNLFRINKFAGWDRVEGGGRLNAGIRYTAQFNQGGYVNVLVGQSYHLFGLNSFTVGGTTNTGLDSGLDKARSDYVANLTYQPNSQFTLTSRFRFDEGDLDVAALRVRSGDQFRALADHHHVRQLRRTAAARIPQLPRRNHRPRQDTNCPPTG